MTVRVTAYTVSRLPDTDADYTVWSVEVVAAGHGRWAVRNMSRCLNRHTLEWDYEPLPSSRTDEWISEHRWDDAREAIDAAVKVEPDITWNGLTSADVLARKQAL